MLELPTPHTPWSAQEILLPIPFSPLLSVAIKLNQDLALGCSITGLCPETDARPSPPPSLSLPDSPSSRGLRDKI